MINKRLWFFIAILCLVWFIVYVPTLFQPPLLDDADSGHAETAKEMIERGDWVTLHLNGIRYYEKPPLMFWAIAASFRYLGVSEWSARLPISATLLALVLVTFLFGRRIYGDTGGFYAGLILATGFGPYIFTRILISDILVTLWLTLALYLFYIGLEQGHPSRLVCWSMAAVTGLNVLSKGLIGVVFPGGIMFLYLVLTRNLAHLKRMRLVSSALVFLAVAAPWHILAAIRNPDIPDRRGFVWFYFVNEHIMRYLNKRVPHDYGTVPLFLFWGLLLLWIFPWSSFLIQALAAIPRRLKDLTVRQRANLLLAVWAGLILLFFSFSTRQEYYSLPALPALALLVGAVLAQEGESLSGARLRMVARRSSTVLLVLAVPAFIFAVVAVVWTARAPVASDVASMLTKNPDKYALSFGHFSDLTFESLRVFRFPLIITGAALFLGTGLNFLFRRRGLVHAGNAALAVMMIVVLLCSHRGLVIFSPVLTSKSLATAILREYRPGDIIVINGEYEQGSTLNFYTGVRVHILNGRSANLWYGSFYPDAPQIFHDNASFKELWNGPSRVYLWTEEDRRGAALEGIDPDTVHELAHSGGKVILTNREPDNGESNTDGAQAE
jgi:4-amino-4-deoxy-L-arabinose transferase-like glycosyltransferase